LLATTAVASRMQIAQILYCAGLFRGGQRTYRSSHTLELHRQYGWPFAGIY
jgi:hypothetical protein